MIGDLKKMSDKFLGFYRGLVAATDEEAKDTNKWGRIKVRVHPMMDGADIPIDALPWAVPAFSSTEGSGDGYGQFNVPRVGSEVWVFFEAGSPAQPVYFASAPNGVHGLPNGDDADGDPNWYQKNYPDRKGVQYQNGLIIYTDEKNGEVYMFHPSGTWIKIGGSDGDYGKVEAYVKDSLVAVVEEDVDVTANQGDVTVTALLGAIKLAASAGNIELTAVQDFIALVTTAITFTVPLMNVIGNLQVSTGASGTFDSDDGKTITVVKGIITSIV